MQILWFRRRSMPISVNFGLESFNHDRVLLARRRRVKRGFPLIHFAAFVYLVSVLRVFAIAEVGPGHYAARIEQMQAGGMIERAAAFIMAPDDLSRQVARNLRNGFEFIGGASG